MIRVMIVEDEPPIMRVISKFVESFSDEFKVTATAMNGKKALEILETEEVDVVFTDIKMPVMGGLKLTEHIRERWPEMIIIIISGFQDFEYARTALKFQVYDYLLKPIAEDNIHTVLKKVEGVLSVKDKEKQRQKIINLINENHNENPAEKTDNHQEPGYAVILICVGPYPLIPNDSMIPAKSIWEEVNIEEKLTEILLSEENMMCFNGKSAAEMAVVFEAEDEKRIVQAVGELAEMLQSSSSLPVTLVTTHQITKLSNVGEVLKALREKLYIRIKLFASQVVWLDDKEEKENNTLGAVLDTKLIAETIYSASRGESSQLSSYVHTALIKLTEAGFTQLQIVSFFNTVLSTIYLQSQSVNKDTSMLKMDLDIALSNAADAESLAKEISFMILEASGAKGQSVDKNNITDIAQTIEEYLQNNYKESITTNMLSKKFGFVPSYISKLFRAYKGMSPSEYLTYYRIEKSKQMMLSNPDLLWKEVARMVGFNDQYHFSKTFKKQTGIWPTEYVVKK